VARELGVNDGTLGNWVARDRRRGGDGGLGEDERLCRENAELAVEGDAFKRWVALWVKDAMGR
jgi:transposase